MNTVYTSEEYGNVDQRLQIQADFAQAASPVRWRETDSEKWKGTPFQVADTRHNPNTAIDMVAKWLDQG